MKKGDALRSLNHRRDLVQKPFIPAPSLREGAGMRAHYVRACKVVARSLEPMCTDVGQPTAPARENTPSTTLRKVVAIPVVRPTMGAFPSDRTLDDQERCACGLEGGSGKRCGTG